MKTLIRIAIASTALFVLAACAALPGPQVGSTQTPANTPAPSQTPVPTSDGQPGGPLGTNPAPQAAVRYLAAKLGIAAEAIQVVSFEPVEWNDACLGVVVPGEMCAQVVTPGYKLILSAAGKQYELHTNQAGDAVRLVEAAPAEGSLQWTSATTPCTAAQIALSGVQAGACDATPAAPVALQPARVEEFKALVAAYQSFTADTPAGKVVFTGKGSAAATPAEQRSAAEWAALVAQEAVAGRGSAAAGLAFAWHREGGIAGFCDDLAIYRTGFAYATSCRSNTAQNLGFVRLDAAQLEQLFAWVDGLKSFDSEHKDAATADAMTVRLAFSGDGKDEASSAQQEAMQNLAASLFMRASNAAGSGLVPAATPQ